MKTTRSIEKPDPVFASLNEVVPLLKACASIEFRTLHALCEPIYKKHDSGTLYPDLECLADAPDDNQEFYKLFEVMICAFPEKIINSAIVVMWIGRDYFYRGKTCDNLEKEFEKYKELGRYHFLISMEENILRARFGQTKVFLTAALSGYHGRKQK